MGALKDLKLPKGEKPELPPEGEVPEQRGEFKPTPWPGKVVLLLPSEFKGWGTVERKIRDTDENKVVRLEHTFDEDSPLTIVQHEYPEFEGDTLRYVRLSTMERKRGGRDSNLYVSDAFYLLRDAFKVDEKELRKLDLEGWGKAIEKVAGKKFGADIEWSANCQEKDKDGNPKKIRAQVVVDGQQRIMEIDGQFGCGKRMYMGDIKNFAQMGEDGKLVWPNMVTCVQCEAAVLYPNVQLARYRPAE